jgi:hypothetical protein
MASRSFTKSASFVAVGVAAAFIGTAAAGDTKITMVLMPESPRATGLKEYHGDESAAERASLAAREEQGMTMGQACSFSGRSSGQAEGVGCSVTLFSGRGSRPSYFAPGIGGRAKVPAEVPAAGPK